ncbi:DUF4352 domain-containing protein [Mammaliicoccus vitulinus]|uniref:DUF4352 domain-containing protein n=1 Tax=Mammaliicoccus vitulinus TaxID=71237 RepID=UPI003B9E9D0A
MENGNKKSNKGWLWALLGCLGGIVFIFIIIVVVVMLFFNGVDEVVNGTKEEQKNRSKTSEKTFKLEDTVKADGVDVKLEKAEFITPSEEDAGNPENGKALRVYLKFKNNNDDQVLAQDADFSMKVNGENYEPWYGSGDGNDGFSHQLNNGNTGSGYVTYDVPENSKYTLEMNFTPNFDTVKAKWEIDKSDIKVVSNSYEQSTEETNNEKNEEMTNDSAEESTDEIVTRGNVMDIVEEYEGETLDTDMYTFKEPEQRDDGSWGFAFYTKDGELAGSYIVDEDGIVSKFDESGIEE